MKTLQVTKRCKKGVKKLKAVIDTLCAGNDLETKYRDQQAGWQL